jgi:transcriptional regulator with GAF, ATPase, and Fis domain
MIAATNRDLLVEARAGRFRLDLYYRLCVFPIELPPLRERLDDAGLLAEHFIEQSARRLGVPAPRLTRLNMQELQGYDWPGNIRELQNVVERAVILARGGSLRFALPRPEPQRSSPGIPPLASGLSLDELVVREREIVSEALRRGNGKIYGPDGAAQLLKVRPTTLTSMMKRLGIARRSES